MKSKNKNAYNWRTIINEKAIWEFQSEMGLTHLKLSFDHYYVLSYIVELCTNPRKNNNLISKVIEGELFIYMSSSFILENLILLNIEARTLKRILSKLIENNYLERKIVNKNQRFLRPSNELQKFFKPNFQICNSELNNLAKEIGKKFGKSTKRQLIPVINFLESLNDLDYFKNQFDAYAEFKNYTNDIWHQFENFTELWDSNDWQILLDRRKHQDQISRFSDYS